MENQLYDSHTILCVDDDQDDLQMLREAIEAIDPAYQIIEAHNGEDGLAQLQQMKETGTLPCLIVLDINMPKMDGRQAFQKIRSDAALSAVPVVIFSTSSSPLDKMFFANKDVEYFTKPVSFRQFIDAATRLLKHCSMQAKR